MNQTILAALVLVLVAGGGCFENITGPTFNQVTPADYIRDDDYSKWVIEVDYVEGHRPTNAWLDELVDKMGALVKKSTIQVKIGNTLPSQSVWRDADIAQLQKDHQDEKTGGDTVVTWVAYLDGEFEKGSVYGVAYNWDRIAIFTEAIEDGCTPLSGCVANTNTVQRAVLIHEFGHAIGLVNRGVDMVVNREGSGDQARHSTNSGSVMYYAVNNAGIFGLNNIPTTFDTNDKRDIACFGGKGNC